MKVEFRYSGNVPPEKLSVLLEKGSHESARRAEWAAERTGLGITLFSYSEILDQVSYGQDPVEVCAQATGTEYEEQIKALFVSDAPLDGKHRPNSAVGVLKYSDRLDYKKLATVIWNERYPGRRDIVMGKLTQNLPDLEALGIVPGYLGINQRTVYVPEFVIAGPGETFDPYTDQFLSKHIIDESLRELSRFCMLVGFGQADALVIIDGRNRQLGERLDAFFSNFFGGGMFTISDIKEKRK